MYLARFSALLPFTLIGGGYLAWSWSSVLGGLGGDNAHYLFLARHYSPYSATDAVTEYFARNSIYPPLFPLLLGLTGGGESLLAAHLITTVCLLGAFAVFYGWLRREGVGRLVAQGALVIWALVPAVYMQTLSVHSENLYLLCSLTALAGASAIQRESRDPAWMIIAVCAVVAGYLTRGAGLALVAAWVGWLWLNRMPGRAGFSLLALVPVFLWTKYGGAASMGYWGQLAHGYPSPATFFTQIWEQARHLLSGWITIFGTTRAAMIAGTLLLVTGLLAALWRIWLRRLDGLYVGCYLGMILFWPFPAEAQRMLFVLLPVLLAHTAWALRRWGAVVRFNVVVQVGIWGVLLVATTSELVRTGQRFFTPLPPRVPESYRRTEAWYAGDEKASAFAVQAIAAVESDLHAIGERVPEEDCIFSVKPSVVAFLSGRHSKEPPGPDLEPSAFEHELQVRGCRYLYLMAFATPAYPVVMYPYQRLQSRLDPIQPAWVEDAYGRKSAVALLARLK